MAKRKKPLKNRMHDIQEAFERGEYVDTVIQMIADDPEAAAFLLHDNLRGKFFEKDQLPDNHVEKELVGNDILVSSFATNSPRSGDPGVEFIIANKMIQGNRMEAIQYMRELVNDPNFYLRVLEWLRWYCRVQDNMMESEMRELLHLIEKGLVTIQ